MYMKIKPYYLVQSWSPTARKQLESHLSTEMGASHRCRNLTDAHERSIQYAASLCESKMLGRIDWEPRVRLVNDQGSFLVDAVAALRQKPSTLRPRRV